MVSENLCGVNSPQVNKETLKSPIGLLSIPNA
jgi:hypothetical protein